MPALDYFPEEMALPLKRVQMLRYGENPHQRAAFYRWAHSPTSGTATVAGAEVLHGKELSFNNLLDLDVALAAVSSFTAPAIAIIKHTNPCGLACGDTLVDAYKRAHAGDPISAYGGIIGSNRRIDTATAQEITQLFYEAIIAPGYTPESLELLKSKKNLRLLATHYPIEPKNVNSQALLLGRPDVRSVSGGLLLQTPDVVGEQMPEYTVVTERDPTLEEVTDLMFAWKVVQHVKSNAIVLAHKLAVIGVGAGQMNRVASVQLALEKAADRARGSVLASDAYFPFPDGVEAAAKAAASAGEIRNSPVRTWGTAFLREASRWAANTLERASSSNQPGPAAQCAQELGPARAFYTTRDSVADIEAVRQALGVDRISLYAVSYGTKDCGVRIVSQTGASRSNWARSGPRNTRHSDGHRTSAFVASRANLLPSRRVRFTVLRGGSGAPVPP